ncbi:glycoside hydrolase family 105 protein [Punctularia strigosozonata HHB-11173 SS5]|uniref:Glycoside hydrolase family 105 protein n=1 Tax=Punctularia strigosozonata (strain HHB-11173) TaxID=741275 RepID=R7S2J5_PUNST|nr:glycoside hydrolase family 105 protein [Punctularia strigosozonata HHB-11173 SS5]EIN04615.1 glycoside hydrolase family 105 protein [Punctularia strigosozonata HHB-11173 SS5]
MLIHLLLLPLLASTWAKPTSYAIWSADSAISRGQGNGLGSNGAPLVSYEHGEFWWALRLLYEKTGNKIYFDYIRQGVDRVVAANGTIGGGYGFTTDYQLDPIRTGPTFLYLYDVTGQQKYKIAADKYRQQLETHPRTAQGQFWHKLRYPNQGWLDGIYMGDVFYAQYTHDFQYSNKSAWDDVQAQFTLMFENTLQNATSPPHLLYHGYDYSHAAPWASPDRGHSPESWDRALGWYMMALVDTLDIFPPAHPGHAALLSFFRTLAPRVKAAADAQTGVWWLVLSQPGRAGNYFESSGSAMFVYALLKGVRRGHIEDDGIVKAMRKAYGYMVENWAIPNANGTIDWQNTVQVGSLDGNGTFEYYTSVPTDVNDLKGLAAFTLASIEYENL